VHTVVVDYIVVVHTVVVDYIVVVHTVVVHTVVVDNIVVVHTVVVDYIVVVLVVVLLDSFVAVQEIIVLLLSWYQNLSVLYHYLLLLFRFLLPSFF
jgi:hypothetical protein